MTMQADAPVVEVVEDVALPAPAEVEAPQPVAETPPPSVEVTPVIPSPPAITLPPTPPSNLPPEVQEYVTRLEEQNRTAREQNERQILDQSVAQYAQQLEQQYGLTSEQAQSVAKMQGDILYRQYQSEQMRRGQVRAAIAIAKQFSVDPLQLVDLATPEAMRQTAQNLSATTRQATENAQLKARIAALEKGRVPAQTFSQGAQPGAGAGLTGDNLETAWLKHETEHPDRPNPYDSAYRAMLRG